MNSSCIYHQPLSLLSYSLSFSFSQSISTLRGEHLAEALIRVLETPNTSPSCATILVLSIFTRICDQETFILHRSSTYTKKLLKGGKIKLLKMLKGDESLVEYPQGMERKDVEILASRCGHMSDKCIIC